MKSPPSWLRVLIGSALGVGLCVLLIIRLDVRAGDALRLWSGLSWSWCGIVFLLSAALLWTGAHKWALWAQGLHQMPEPSDGYFLRHFVWQNWVAQFVPPSVAIVVGRGVAHKVTGDGSFKKGAVGGLYDQAMEFTLLAGLLPVGLGVLMGGAGGMDFLVGGAFGMFASGLVLYLFLFWFRPVLRSALPALLFWSALRVLLVVVRLALGGAALGIPIDPLVIAAAAPAVAFLAILPLTPGNLGIAEWGWVGILTLAGQEAQDVALLALGFRLLILVVQSLLLGGYEAYVRLRAAL